MWLGDVAWIYLGDNRSMMMRNLSRIVEPCVMEVFDDGRFIYGNSSLVDAPWFVIDKKSHEVLKGDGHCEIMTPSDRTRIPSILHGLRTFQDWRGRRE